LVFLLSTMAAKSFTEKLDPESLKYFNDVCKKSFSEQAVHFLNAYWPEIHTQAEFIFTVAWEVIKYADMHSKGISLVYKYDEGNELELNFGLYFYEKLCKFVEDPKNAEWTGEKFKISQPVMLTAIRRKQELREKVDVNFDGKISFLEYLLDQYQAFANPSDFVVRAMKGGDEHPEIRKARLALEEVNKRIREYEAEKARLTELAQGSGVKALTAKNQLAQLDASPLAEELNRALITAEAAVRMATKKFGGGGFGGGEAGTGCPTDGAVWWMNRDLEEKKKKYGPKAKN